MIRTFRYPLHPTKAQAEVLETWRIACQQLYNAALQERRDAWKKCGVTVTRYDQQKELTELRRTEPEWSAIPTVVERSSLIRVENAFKAFFRRHKAKEKPGYPRFRSRDRYDSFGIGRAKTIGDGVLLPASSYYFDIYLVLADGKRKKVGGSGNIQCIPRVCESP